MDKLEFRKRVYADPQELDQETLAAAAASPELQRILEQTRALDTRLDSLKNSTAAPAALRDRLLQIPETETLVPDASSQPNGTAANQPWYRHFALAASLVLAVGATALYFLERGPNAGEMAFGNQLIAHIYHEIAEIDAINAGTLQREFAFPAVNEVMGNSGTQIRNADFLQQIPVRYANPCYILSTANSSHLILQSDFGAINIITIDNEPVSQEFAIGDERFTGIVIPLAEGNLIIIGEQEQGLRRYRDLFSENLEWVI